MDSQAHQVDDSDDEVVTNQQSVCGLRTIHASDKCNLEVFDDPVLPSFSMAKPVDSTSAAEAAPDTPLDGGHETSLEVGADSQMDGVLHEHDDQPDSRGKLVGAI